MQYVLGRPSFGRVMSDVDNFSAPISEIESCKKVLREIKSGKDRLTKINEEYLAIFLALIGMEIDFSITFSALEKEYRQQLEDSLKGLRSGFGYSANVEILDISEHCPIDLASFPKDIAMTLVAHTLVNPEVKMPKNFGNENASSVLFSPYGEGGRVLNCKDTVLISNHLTLGELRPIEKARVSDFDQMKINLGLIPLPAAGTFSLSKLNETFPNDHLDRIACLIEGKNGKLHLVADPKIHTYKKDENKNWIIQEPEESLKEIGKVCESLGIELHYPEAIEVPYALNLFQFEDGRILMTGGDDCVCQLISEIVGEEMMNTTEVPIQLYPIFNRAGIGCVINKHLPQIVLQPHTLIM